jgi:hypothetical protein
MGFVMLGMLVMGVFQVVAGEIDIGLFDGLGDKPKTISDEALLKVETEALEKGVTTSEILIDKGITGVESIVVSEYKEQFRSEASRILDSNDASLFKQGITCLSLAK